MSNVITVEAKLTGDAASMVAALKQATNAMQATQRASENMGNRGLGALAGGASRAVGTIVKLGVAAAATGVAIGVGFAGAAVKSGLTRLEAIQDSTVALTHMLGSATAAANLTAKALAIVKGTPFAFPQFAQAARTLVAFGVQAGKVPKVLQAVADSAAASGQGADAIDGIVQALGHMQVAGKLTGEVVQSLGFAGVNATALIANGMHISTAKVQELQSKGLIPADKAMQILVDGIENGSKGAAGDFKALAGAAQDLGKTVSGSLGNVKAGFARMGASWLKPFTETLPNALNNGVIPLLDAMGAAGLLATQRLSDTGVLQNFTKGLNFLTKALDPAKDSFGGLIQTLSPLGAIVKALQAAWPKLQAPLKAVGTIVTQTLIPAIANLFVAMVPVLPLIGKLVEAFARGLTGAIPAATTTLTALLTVVTPLVTAVSNLPTPVLALGVAMVGLGHAGLPVGDILSHMALGLASVITGVNGAGQKIPTFSAALRGIGTAGGGIKGALSGLAGFITGPWGMAIGGAISILGILALSAMPQAAKNTDELAASFDRLTGKMTANTRASVINELQTSGAFKDAAKFGIGQKTLTDAALGDTNASKAIRKTITKTYVNPSAKDQQNFAGGANVLNEIGGQNEAIKKAQEVAKNTLAANNQTAKSEASLAAAFKTATGAIKENGKSFNASTTGGKANSDAVKALGKSYQDLLGVEKRQGVSQAVINENQSKAITSGQAMAAQLGLQGLAADMFVSKLLKIPVAKITQVRLDKAAADKAVAVYNASLSKIPERLNTRLTVDSAQARAAILALARNLASLRAEANISPTVHLPGKGQATGGIWNGTHQYMAAGGFSGARQSMMAAGGSNITWAEKSTGWESYISGDKSMAQRSASIWAATGKRLGLLNSGGGSGSGGVVELGPQAMKLLRILAGKDTTVSIGDETISASAGRGTKKSVLSGRG